ncbi:transketolase [Myxococcota bacterium]|nr:transketolase [Myxococcota bacterium]MBU1412812.1 transketolase [Myxococcota bacterium]MBU1508884.1 transketolase [Myxococcota bacterium]
MHPSTEKTLQTIRMLAAETIEKAKSGHPGLPLGAAPMAYALFHDLMKMDPAHPDWPDRDRFVLSAGHGSSLLYVMLHLYGFGVTTADLQKFRQLGSRTPGHPEVGCLPGVETTTGPLGAGFSNAVGMALAERRVRTLFGPGICDHRTFVLASDGDLMEGITQEAASFAGHQKLDRLVVFYDSNRISIEGSTDIAFTEDTAGRFTALGWACEEVEAENPAIIKLAYENLLKNGQGKPKLLICHTKIGRGAGKKEGTAECHGSPLGKDVIEQMRIAYAYGEAFSVAPEVVAHIESTMAARAAAYAAWNGRLEAFAAASPEKFAQYNLMSGKVPGMPEYPIWAVGASESTRKSSGRILQTIAKADPRLFGGSADLAPSNNTWIDVSIATSAERPEGRNIHFGIREHGMGGIVNGMALHGQVLPYGATFLVFSDYMRGAVRLSALMKLPVIWIFTHDSIHVGEDGPTHQPVEHADALRLIPGLSVIRPADGNECVAAYQYARTNCGPTAILLTRQNLPQLAGSIREPEHLTGYVVAPASDAKVQLLASGSEVHVAIEAAKLCAARGVAVEVVSVPMLSLTDPGTLPGLVKNSPAKRKIALEAGTCRLFAGFGVPERIGLSTFGESAPEGDVVKHFGLNPDQVAERILSTME